jgi:hypothetical protein
METLLGLSKKGQVLGWIIMFVVLIAAVGIMYMTYGRTIPTINQNVSSTAENTTIENTRSAFDNLFDMSSILFWIIAGGILIVAAIMMFTWTK